MANIHTSLVELSESTAMASKAKNSFQVWRGLHTDVVYMMSFATVNFTNVD